ncbi:methyltransferase [Micromonospora robiginosa]|uniref:Methyltransferase n=1 Tax=Micromonospora robiginosa TaxID=2749844 RepID=A0A7L6B1W6_9ACTN|nr:methyltransferase [Micromonospora ferruginea]QLQ35876.1 methyltransferase [Micromonospora ferruginea]
MVLARPRADLEALTRLTELADYIVPFTVRVVADLGVADQLADGPRPVAELADATGAHAPALLRALRALAGKGIFTEVEPEVFALTPLAEPLRADHPLSLRDAYPLLAADVRAWAGLDRCLRTGEAAFPRVHGADYWSYLERHPADSLAVDRWMSSLTKLHLRTVLPAWPWAQAREVVDVGGGDGAFLAGLLTRYRHLRGVLLDLPHVVAAAPALLDRAAVTDRCRVVPGSFFDPLPAGADLYVLKTILPGWDDAQATAILRRVAEAMRPESRLLLLEAIVPAGDAFDVAKLVDVHTLVLTAGRHRTHAELLDLLSDAGLRLDRVVGTPTLTVIAAGPAGARPTTP